MFARRILKTPGVQTVQKIRVVVANRPRLMRELVLATLAEQPDIEVVGEVQNDREITEAVETKRPDLLIIALDENGEHHGLCGFLLGRYPTMQILAISSGSDDSTYYRAFVDIRSRRVPTSEEGILTAVREGFHPAIV
jgi:DNA-binding NarL/FixJ family response regulator